MTTLPVRTFIGMLALTVIAAALAGWLGVQYGVHQARPAADLDTLLHERIDLTAGQHRKLDTIERAFGIERRTLQTEMRAANRDLATAITHRHSYGPEARQAVERFHRATIRLQEDTIRHVLAMRAVMSANQTAEFDKVLTETLTTDTP